VYAGHFFTSICHDSWTLQIMVCRVDNSVTLTSVTAMHAVQSFMTFFYPAESKKGHSFAMSARQQHHLTLLLVQLEVSSCLVKPEIMLFVLCKLVAANLAAGTTCGCLLLKFVAAPSPCCDCCISKAICTGSAVLYAGDVGETAPGLFSRCLQALCAEGHPQTPPPEATAAPACRQHP